MCRNNGHVLSKFFHPDMAKMKYARNKDYIETNWLGRLFDMEQCRHLPAFLKKQRNRL